MNIGIIEVLVFVAVLVMVFGSYLSVSDRASYRQSVQSRLQAEQRHRISTKEELFQVRRSRSLTSQGHYVLTLFSLNELLVQSGVSMGWRGVGVIFGATGIAVFTAASLLGVALVPSLVFAAVAAAAVPVWFLRSMRSRRRDKFEGQLPDALDILVRSLRAGHSLPAAIASVGSHMPDPIGAEFNLTAAEVTYGLDLETAMVNMTSRVGQPDLGLIVLAVSLQSKTGGNLAEILSNLSKIIRARFKLRRKAFALSAEGRFSAIMLTMLPIVLFGILKLISPGYYGDVFKDPLVKPILGAAVAWMLIGDYIMFRMVRLKV
jgi:tight adherence protein B